MKKVFIMIISGIFSMLLQAQSTSVTYTNGDIPTTYIASASITTGSNATQPGQLAVTIPTGANVHITSVSVIYQMTARNGAYMSEQRSFLRCVSSGGITEPVVYSGVGNTQGTYSYNRTNLNIANNVTGGGNILFELHAFRTYYSDGGSNITYNYVNNSTWKVTVFYTVVPVPNPPTNLTATAYTDYMGLKWTRNVLNENVIIAYNTTGVFGQPVNGTSYAVNSVISGGGTVIYNGSMIFMNHCNINPGTTYYYKAWSVNTTNYYSTGITASNTTNSRPLVTNVTFINNISTTGFVDIYYNVADANDGSLFIDMEVSKDGGTTYDFPCTQVTGDIGIGISTGNNKHIAWNFAREHSGVSGNNFKIKILANDFNGDQVNYKGKIYNTIVIGSQIWLKENLNVGTRINGSQNQANGNGIEKYCYNDIEANCDTYGGLYQWNEAMAYSTVPGSKGICPTGWHIPTNAELQTLIEVVNSNTNLLKAIGQGSGDGVGTNTSGFSGLLAGSRDNGGGYYFLGTETELWSSSVGYSDNTAFILGYLGSSSSPLSFDSLKYHGFSIRCIKN